MIAAPEDAQIFQVMPGAVQVMEKLVEKVDATAWSTEYAGLLGLGVSILIGAWIFFEEFS